MITTSIQDEKINLFIHQNLETILKFAVNYVMETEDALLFVPEDIENPLQQIKNVYRKIQTKETVSLTPLQQYILYYSIVFWYESANMGLTFKRFLCSEEEIDYIKTHIQSDDMDQTIESYENPIFYIDLCFKDLNFLEENLLPILESYFEKGTSEIHLDDYVDVMSKEDKEKYLSTKN